MSTAFQRPFASTFPNHAFGLTNSSKHPANFGVRDISSYFSDPTPEADDSEHLLASNTTADDHEEEGEVDDQEYLLLSPDLEQVSRSELEGWKLTARPPRRI